MDFKIPPNTPSVNSIFDVPKNFTGHIIITDGLYYYQNGKRHREDGPAVERSDGTKEWYYHGEPHREDGPAIEWASGTKYWYLNGKRHRLDGPAIEYANRSKHWYLNGNRHRTDGPACEYPNGEKSWYLNNQKYGINNDFINESWIHFQNQKTNSLL